MTGLQAMKSIRASPVVRSAGRFPPRRYQINHASGGSARRAADDFRLAPFFTRAGTREWRVRWAAGSVGHALQCMYTRRVRRV